MKGVNDIIKMKMRDFSRKLELYLPEEELGFHPLFQPLFQPLFPPLHPWLGATTLITLTGATE